MKLSHQNIAKRWPSKNYNKTNNFERVNYKSMLEMFEKHAHSSSRGVM